MSNSSALLRLPLLCVASLLVSGCTEPPAPTASLVEPVHNRCKGVYAGSECQRIENELKRESPEEAKARRDKLEDERVRNMALAQAQPAEPEEPARRWFAPDKNFTRCLSSNSPADQIRMIREYGKTAGVNDLPDGAVEVTEQKTGLTEVVWTYYPDERTCVAALPRSQPVPSRYE